MAVLFIEFGRCLRACSSHNRNWTSEIYDQIIGS
jgi:hypothetical protein